MYLTYCKILESFNNIFVIFLKEISKPSLTKAKSDLEDDDTASTTSDVEYFKKLQKKICPSSSNKNFIKSKDNIIKTESLAGNRLTISGFSINRIIGSPRNPNQLSYGQKKLKKRHEKSVVILVLIVIVFVLCHSFRLGVQTYQVRQLFVYIVTMHFLCAILNVSKPAK